MMETEPGAALFVIDGATLEVPSFDSLTMGETIVLYEYSGVTLDQLDEEKSVPPGFIAGLMHVAYQRANPQAKKHTVRQLIEGCNLAEALSAFQQAQQEADPDPPESPQTSDATENASNGTLNGNDGSSGDASTSDSVSLPASAQPISTGTSA